MGWTFWGQTTVRARDFFFSISILPYNWYQCPFMGIKCPGHVIDYPPHLVPILSMSRAITLFLFCTCHGLLWGDLYLFGLHSLCIYRLHRLDFTTMTLTRGPIQNTFLLRNVLILEGWWDNDSYGSKWYPSILAESIYYFIFIQVSEPSQLCKTVSESNSNESRLLPAQPDRSVDYRKSYELGEDFFLYRRKQLMHHKGQGDKQEH